MAAGRPCIRTKHKVQTSRPTRSVPLRLCVRPPVLLISSSPVEQQSLYTHEEHAGSLRYGRCTPSRCLWRLRSTETVTAVAQQTRRLLYVAVPGAGNGTEYRGVGICLVYDIDKGHAFVKRIPTWPAAARQQPEQVRGIAASAGTRRLFVSTVKRLAAFDLVDRENPLGEVLRRHLLRPPGAVSRRRNDLRACFWCAEVVCDRRRERRAAGNHRRHGLAARAIFSRDGSLVFLSAWESPVLSVVDAKARKIVREVGPFTDYLCPFTTNGKA